MTANDTTGDDPTRDLDGNVGRLIEFAAMPWESPAPGLRVKQVCQGNQRIRVIEFGEDFVETDWCKAGHIGFVIEGALEIDFDGRVVNVKAGDGLFIPAGESSKHRARVPCGKAILFAVENKETSVSD